MVLVDFTKDDLEWIAQGINFCLGKGSELYKKIEEYINQENFVYFQGEMLDAEESDNFLAELKRPATEKEIRDAREAVEFAREVKTFTDGYCYSCKKEGELDWYREVCTNCFEKID